MGEIFGFFFGVVFTFVFFVLYGLDMEADRAYRKMATGQVACTLKVQDDKTQRWVCVDAITKRERVLP